MMVRPMPPQDLADRLRRATVGDLLPSRALRRPSARILDATAFVVPGDSDLATYRDRISAAEADLAAWDGRVVVLEPDGWPAHRLVIVDRYGQVYHVADAADATALPPPAELVEWFRFLATACPECGVIDDPRPGAWVP
jgi:hypothetical protein